MKNLILILAVAFVALGTGCASSGKLTMDFHPRVDISYINAVDSTSFMLEDPANPGVFFPQYIPVKIQIKSVTDKYNNNKITYKVVK